MSITICIPKASAAKYPVLPITWNLEGSEGCGVTELIEMKAEKLVRYRKCARRWVDSEI